jgi:hypothetical protein
MWETFMEELRHEHLGTPAASSGPTVRATLQAGYEAVVARKALAVGSAAAP